MRAVRIAFLAVVVVLCGCASSPGRFDFALIGDQQYDAESDAKFPRLMADIDRADADFVVHLGDFKAGVTMPCEDELYRSRRRLCDASRHPFVYTPGDNDWTDCHNAKAGGYVPEERLEYRDRMRANLAWMRKAFALAKRDNAAGVAIFTQANPRFERAFRAGA